MSSWALSWRIGPGFSTSSHRTCPWRRLKQEPSQTPRCTSRRWVIRVDGGHVMSGLSYWESLHNFHMVPKRKIHSALYSTTHFRPAGSHHRFCNLCIGHSEVGLNSFPLPFIHLSFFWQMLVTCSKTLLDTLVHRLSLLVDFNLYGH